MKAIEQYFHVALYTMLYKMVLTYNSADETLVCDHSNESYWVTSTFKEHWLNFMDFVDETVTCVDVYKLLSAHHILYPYTSLKRE